MSKTHAFLNGIDKSPDAVATQRAFRQVDLNLTEFRQQLDALSEELADIQAGNGAVNSVTAGSSMTSVSPNQGDVIVDVVPANFTGIPQAGVTNLVTDLAGKAPLVHGHAIADISGLQTALDDKIDEVIAGTNLSGGGTSGAVTLNVVDDPVFAGSVGIGAAATHPLEIKQGPAGDLVRLWNTNTSGTSAIGLYDTAGVGQGFFGYGQAFTIDTTVRNRNYWRTKTADFVVSCGTGVSSTPAVFIAAATGNVNIGPTASDPSTKLRVQGNQTITGGLTVEGGDIAVTSTGSARLHLAADTDNVTEADVAQVRFSQDGVISTGVVGLDDGNHLLIGVNSTTSPGIVFATRSDGTSYATSADAKMRIANNGVVTVFGSLVASGRVTAGEYAFAGAVIGRLKIGHRVFTAGGTYTPTSGTKAVRVRMVGGGGGGGAGGDSSSLGSCVGAGGAAGTYFEKWIDVGSTFSSGAVTIGAAGAGAVPTAGGTPVTGGTGGDTSVVINGTTYTAKGGLGGPGAFGDTSFAQGGAGQAGSSTGDVTYQEVGGNAFTVTNGGGSVFMHSGAGGNSPFGTGGAGLVHQTASGAVNLDGNDGGGYGTGGGGQCFRLGGTTRHGGDGTAGLVIIEEYA